MTDLSELLRCELLASELLSQILCWLVTGSFTPQTRHSCETHKRVAFILQANTRESKQANRVNKGQLPGHHPTRASVCNIIIQGNYLKFRTGSRDGAVVRALTSHQLA